MYYVYCWDFNIFLVYLNNFREEDQKILETMQQYGDGLNAHILSQLTAQLPSRDHIQVDTANLPPVIVILGCLAWNALFLPKRY